MITSTVEVMYFDFADEIYHRNIKLLENPFCNISITTDMTVHKSTSTSYIGITEHLYLPCPLSAHSSDAAMQQCIHCTRFETIKLGCVKFECSLKKIDDYAENAIFGNDYNYDESLTVQNEFDKYIVIRKILIYMEQEYLFEYIFFIIIPRCKSNLLRK